MTIIDLTTVKDDSSQSQHAVIDLVAIHGVYEDAIETWTEPQSGTLWLRDLLPFQHYKIRILTYGYQGAALTSPGDGQADQILSHATSLVAELCADRQLVDAFQRPIIFICHGLGGILIKRALAFSGSRHAKAVEHLRSIFISTAAILFLATPHHGISKKALLLPHKDEESGPSQFMISLLKGSAMLQEIADQFAPLTKNYSIFNFWEEIESSSNDISAFMVEEDSAAPIWDNVERCGIASTHSGMVKYSSAIDHGYPVVLAALLRYVRMAPTLIKSRWDHDQKMIATERQQEAEALLQPPIPLSLSEESLNDDVNEWFEVPRCSTSYFTGREKQSQIVRKSLGSIQRPSSRTKHHIYVVYGLGGSGKTQFCLKYAEDHHASYWGVFWIDASNDENAQSGFASLGQQAGRGANFAAGMHWLSKASKPWLLILDNADDPDLDVTRYFPSGGNGHILITTRNPSVTTQATVGHARFTGMDPEEGVALLLRSAYPQIELAEPSPQRRNLARSVASELGYLALALAHAGATIRRNIYTLEKYLHYYLGYRKRMMRYPSVKSADETNIITTWEIPFRRIVTRESVEHRDAVELMHVFAFLHFESIPEQIFKRSRRSPEVVESSSHEIPYVVQMGSMGNEDSQSRLRRAISVLCDYSIVDYDAEKASCSLHPVIHGWAQDRLSEDEQRRWLSYASSILANCISPDMEVSSRSFRRLLLPHIDSCLRALKARYATLPESLERSVELDRFAWVYAENGLWKQARSLQLQVVEFRTKKLGKRHEETTQAKSRLANTLWNLGEIRATAETQYEVLLAKFWSRPLLIDWLTWPPWRPDHISYCLALDDLTRTLWLVGRRELSRHTGERAVRGFTRRLGEEDPQTINAMFNLGRTYLHLGDRYKGHSLLVRVLRLQKHFFGMDHPDTLMTRNEVGMSLCLSKRHLAAAEKLVSNVLASRRKTLGEEHAYTLWSMNDLSKVYCERGRAIDAIELLRDLVAPVAIRTLGEDHVGVFMTWGNLGRAYALCQQWKEAEATMLKILPLMSPDHPEWITAVSGYVQVRIHLQKFDEAEKDATKLLDTITKTKILPLDSPRTIKIAEQLFAIYHAQGRTDKIAEVKRRVPAAKEDQSWLPFETLPLDRTSED